MRHFLIAAAAATLMTMVAAPASAENYLFSYKFASTGNVTSGSLSGTLDSDGNTFIIDGVNEVSVDGVPLAPGILAYSLDANYGLAPGAPPKASLDGSFLDFLFYRPDNAIRLLLGVGDGYAAYATATYPAIYPGGVAGALVEFGGTGFTENFVASNFSARLEGAVPEPATWAMLVLGFGTLGSVARRRRLLLA